MKVKTLFVEAFVRYWEDSKVDGEYDTEKGENIPCKAFELWCPIIDVLSGVILNWEIGKTANICYKITDCCGWELQDEDGNVIKHQDDGYVPKTLSPTQNGYGDYIIMNIDSSGKIENWYFNIYDFISDEDELKDWL